MESAKPISSRLQSMRFMARGSAAPKSSAHGTSGQQWTETKSASSPAASQSPFVKAADTSESMQCDAPISTAIVGGKRRMFLAVLDRESFIEHPGIIIADHVSGYQGRMSYSKFSADIDKKSRAQAAADTPADSTEPGETSVPGSSESSATDTLSHKRARTQAPSAADYDDDDDKSQSQSSQRGEGTHRPQSVYGARRFSSGGAPSKEHRGTPHAKGGTGKLADRRR
jgi:hypothetical protein